MEIKVKLELPMMPNFLRINALGVSPTGEAPVIDVKDLTKDQIEEFVTEWRKAFRKHVEKRQQNALLLG